MKLLVGIFYHFSSGWEKGYDRLSMELFFSSSLFFSHGFHVQVLSTTLELLWCFYCFFLEVFHVIPCYLCHHSLDNVGCTRIPSNSLGQSSFTNREDSLMKCSCKWYVVADVWPELVASFPLMESLRRKSPISWSFFTVFWGHSVLFSVIYVIFLLATSVVPAYTQIVESCRHY